MPTGFMSRQPSIFESGIPIIPEHAPFNPDQRVWLNGFLAGYFARVAQAVPSPSEPGDPSTAVPLLILFGSQTGTAQALAQRLGKEAALRAFKPRVVDAADHGTIDWKAEATLLVATSTYGDGD